MKDLKRRCLKRKQNNKLLTITLMLGCLLLTIFINLGSINLKSPKTQFEEIKNINIPSSSQSEENSLFYGVGDSILINETGYLYDFNQKVSVSNAQTKNLSYYLDEEHDWKISEILCEIENIKDERDWVKNGTFQDTNVYNKTLSTPLETEGEYYPNHKYNQNIETISHEGAIAIRIHFQNFSFEEDYDFLIISDANSDIVFIETGFRNDFYTPWIMGGIVDIHYISDLNIQYEGYLIDSYEFYNSSSNYYVNNITWQANSDAYFPSYGPKMIGNNSAMYVGLIGDSDIEDPTIPVTYYNNEYSEIYQNITIPRGAITRGYISFDYFPEYIIDSNELFLYFAINNRQIYSKGFGDIVGDYVDQGWRKWHHTGIIDMALWVNTSNLFESSFNPYEINISVGIKSGGSVEYSGFEERFQQSIWFDNISLVLETISNSSQSDINLRVNQRLLDPGREWGESTLYLEETKSNNPVILEFTTKSPSLSFDLNTTLFGYHTTNSTIDQSLNYGSNYEILNNGSVYWEFYHNFYMPSQYEDFEIFIYKPFNWQLVSALDPTLSERRFLGGDIGDNYILINKTETLYPGWWKFIATSPNYISSNNTNFMKNDLIISNQFQTDDSLQIFTQINHSNNIPNSVYDTEVNLELYYPNDLLWYSETKNPFENGNVSFSPITFDSELLGGKYKVKIFWTNGSEIGGIQSSFLLIHNATIKLLKPNDAIQDLETDAFSGDLIPLQIQLLDTENNLTLDDAYIMYNWTIGSYKYINDSIDGIYETTLNTDLFVAGLNYVSIKAEILGFRFEKITLIVDLVEETKLQRLESEYYLELHSNTSIKFKYATLEDVGISNANISIGIENENYYSVNDIGQGVYIINISTLYIQNLGTQQLSINFSSPSFEPQYYIYQFEIIEQPVILSVFINSETIERNDLFETKFNEYLNISASVKAKFDNEYLNQGNITLTSDTHEFNINYESNNFYNISLLCSSEYFSLGMNYIYLTFNQENYSLTIFEFQLFIDQMDFTINAFNFENAIEVEAGYTKVIEIQITDLNSNDIIHGMNISYFWEFGVGYFQENGDVYQVYLEIPEIISGNYRLNIIASKEGGIYKTIQTSFIITSNIKEPSNYLLWIFLGVLMVIAGILGSLSIRSYILIPRKKRKIAELSDKAQPFKDIRNIQALVVIHKLSGIPLYSKSYSILAEHKNTLFSGFIQAITTVGKEFSEDQKVETNESENLISGMERLLELDFKYFHCVIADKDDVRVVLILKKSASERLKKILGYFINALTIKLNKELENWDGSIDDFEKTIPPIIREYFDLFYKEQFKLADMKRISKYRGKNQLSSMETRVLNVIISITKNNNTFYLDDIIEIVHEENENHIIIAIDSLIKQKLIKPIEV